MKKFGKNLWGDLPQLVPVDPAISAFGHASISLVFFVDSGIRCTGFFAYDSIYPSVDFDDPVIAKHS